MLCARVCLLSWLRDNAIPTSFTKPWKGHRRDALRSPPFKIDKSIPLLTICGRYPCELAHLTKLELTATCLCLSFTAATIARALEHI